ncbi:acyltransferase [Mesobacillus maritimus]|uniref:acyltransferase n=1 Tax=Mesobacillus maritimus TaxID=1643336 RepID=UPI00384F83E7
MSDSFIHPKALVETKNIGKNTRVWAFAHILAGAMIGQDCNICDHTFIENNVIIGNEVTVKSGIYIWDGIYIEDKVFLGPNVVFTNDLRPRSKRNPTEFVKTHICYGASIGANATIIAGNKIGKWSMVGAGAVVTKNVPDYALVYGNPGTIKGYICECTEKLNFENNAASCLCGKNYSYKEGQVQKL